MLVWRRFRWPSPDTAHGRPRNAPVRSEGGLFDKVVSTDNLRLAALKAQRGKRYRREVLRFNYRVEDRLIELRAALRAGTWQPGGHRHFRIFEPKPRWISAAPYADRVVHHALCNVIEPVLDRKLIFDCWANRRGKGSHRAVLRYQRFSARFRYALKIDLRKYFAAIDHEILKRQLGRWLREPRLMDLVARIIDDGIVPEPYAAYFPGDDLFTPLERARGLPIGNLTSQIWANSYMAGFDHWVKEKLGAKGYLRFVDDMVLLDDSAATLRSWLEEVRGKLAELRLTVHPHKCEVRRVGEGVPFLGYMVWPQRIRVRGATLRRFRRRLRSRAGDPEPTVDRARSLAAWGGHVALAGSYRRSLGS